MNIQLRTRGNGHGPITRLVSPGDIGELIKPFVFLDWFEFDPKRSPGIGFHPHSGIATVTVVLEGRLSYEETSGTKGVIDTKGVEWMRAGGGVWHTGGGTGTARVKGYQLWLALPPEMESLPPQALYLDGAQFESSGPARVILGRYGAAASKVPAPKTLNYLDVALKKDEKWRYEMPAGHDIAWVAVHKGSVATPEVVDSGELAVFAEEKPALEFEALEDTGFVLGSAVKHPHELFLGNYSVHTSAEALEKGEAKIVELGKQLRAEGRLA
jgi:redox-sensitive bicupin YhaK (pirin superfamily)